MDATKKCKNAENLMEISGFPALVVGRVSDKTTLNVYTQTEAECEEKLTALIVEMKKEIAALRGQEKAG